MNRIEGSRCLVTGGAGVIGSHVADALLAAGAHRVFVVDNLFNGHVENIPNPANFLIGDISDAAELDRIFYIARPDYVFHLAARMMSACSADPPGAVLSNIVGTQNVIDSSIRHGVCRAVFSSTSSVYGEPGDVPTKEDSPQRSPLLYGATKIAGEALFRAAYAERGLSWVGLRYYNAYSPRQRVGHTYTQIIPAWAARIQAGRPIVVYGDGEQTMDLISAEDIARANLLACSAGTENECYNICTGAGTSVNELADMMVEWYWAQVDRVPDDPNVISRRCGCPEKARASLGFSAKTGVREGVYGCLSKMMGRLK